MVTVEKNGKKSERSVWKFQLRRFEETVELPIAEEKPGEYAVTVSFHLKEDKAWAEAGHEVAFWTGCIRGGSTGESCPEGVK